MERTDLKAISKFPFMTRGFPPRLLPLEEGLCFYIYMVYMEVGLKQPPSL